MSRPGSASAVSVGGRYGSRSVCGEAQCLPQVAHVHHQWHRNPLKQDTDWDERSVEFLRTHSRLCRHVCFSAVNPLKLLEGSVLGDTNGGVVRKGDLPDTHVSLGCCPSVDLLLLHESGNPISLLLDSGAYSTTQRCGARWCCTRHIDKQHQLKVSVLILPQARLAPHFVELSRELHFGWEENGVVVLGRIVAWL